MRRRGGGSALRGHGTPVPDALSLLRAFNMESNPARPVRPSPLAASTIPDMPLDLLDRIRSFPLFLSAPDSFLAAVGKHLRPQVSSAHDHILTEGDEAKAMYWLVRGVVAVTSRDGEATYAELRAGAFFGEIGILMEIPRTATIIARTKCLLVVLKKEDLRSVLPDFPEMRQAIMEEAHERLTILNKKRKEKGRTPKPISIPGSERPQHLARGAAPGQVSQGDMGKFENGTVVNSRKRKSPSPGMVEDSTRGSALGSATVSVRKTLMELPLFSSLPTEILHFLGLSAQPKLYPPFTDIITEGSPGSEIYFIVTGEAEVIHAITNSQVGSPKQVVQSRPRLKPGQYFGEVASLALAPRRTATVRSVTAVECLMISGEVLEELWQRCSPDIRSQVEATARTRISKSNGEDVSMTDADLLPTPSIDDLELNDAPSTLRRSSLSQVTYIPRLTNGIHNASPSDEGRVAEPSDPDPFLSLDMENMRARTGRRGSFAPPSPESVKGDEHNLCGQSPHAMTPLTFKLVHATTPPDSGIRKRPKVQRRASQFSQGTLPDSILVQIFAYLDIHQLMRLRVVSLHWSKLLTTSPHLCHYLDLNMYNRFITNDVLITIICPFLNRRPLHVDVSNCFHLTDEAFLILASTCSPNLQTWRMKSVWDISANAILEMANSSKELCSIDLSNCRKVSDNLLARIIGWVVSEPTAAQLARQKQSSIAPPAPGTVIGCPQLSKLTLSYCKHVTDRSMAHIAVHAHSRIQSIDLTRCTTITDAGFQHWSLYRFSRLETLILADCTYLTDNAIVYLTNAAKELKVLDLSFCCALSDTATEVISLGCPALRFLSLSFCGSAVSDSSLRSISLHLLELRYLSVRGCVRVTGKGVEAVVEGCTKLDTFDVSQCRNLQPWIDRGGCRDWRSGSKTGVRGMLGMAWNGWGAEREVRFIVNAGEDG